jgi:hypothetical protein
MDWLGWGLLSVGLVWFFAATLFGGARSLLISAALFVLGALLYAFG